jgi:hypothetical protein
MTHKLLPSLTLTALLASSLVAHAQGQAIPPANAPVGAAPSSPAPNAVNGGVITPAKPTDKPAEEKPLPGEPHVGAKDDLERLQKKK